MPMLAEIADKMPTVAGMTIAWAVMSGMAAGLAWGCLAGGSRVGAWIVAALSLALGALFISMTVDESFAGNDFAEAIWDELGWPWVIASIATPMMPLAGVVITMMIVRRRRIPAIGVE